MQQTATSTTAGITTLQAASVQATAGTTNLSKRLVVSVYKTDNSSTGIATVNRPNNLFS
jgi:hypothetical protein